ncbi:MAG: L-threonylcarbamoyladenylate synthase [Bifidobacteriaceae bacterium]|jgi:tRNA threonylcarbamoyl adenosine modification protein (Sua5/YciO/YrdC/YwlC family)|nr:L-threonylcarbamoyladenylate synthase [Bifidobacteriaceae bacterium]
MGSNAEAEYDQKEINNSTENDDIIKILKSGYVMQLPTDTLPGYLCDPSNKAAVDKIFAKKNRSHEKRIPILVPKNWNETSLVEKWTPLEKKLIEKHWPGALTFVKRYTTLNHLYLGNYSETIAIRCPDDNVLLNILAQFGPLACTSANLSGKKIENTTSLGSTIIRVVDEKIHILRQGDLKIEEGCAI